MFDKFGEFDSFSEINELAENLLNEGDIESLKVVAKENGIQADFVDLYTNGEIPELCDKLTAALGKIDVEAAELKPKEIMEDWVEYLRGQCMENELLAHNQDFAEWPGNNQSHRRRERAGISDGNKRLSKKISGERKVIKTEKADFKLKEVISRIGMRIWVY